MLAAAAFAATAGAASPVGSAQFRTVDVPASVCAQPCYSPPVFTQVSGVNNAGTLVGVWNGTAGDQHGFIQQPGGQPVSFDALGVPCCTTPQAINDEGTVVGSVCTCQGSTFLYHGWVRSRDGTVTELDDPSAPDQTFPTGINDSGVIVGEYVADASGSSPSGFVYDREKWTSFHYPGSTATYVSGINNSGAIVGVAFDAVGLPHGFLYQNGKFTDIDGPGAPGGFCEGTGISAGGVIIGDICNDVSFSGWALSQGQFSSLIDPNAAPNGTYVGGISENGRMVGGFYFDASGVGHGLVATLSP
jgi:probable HAF family extracellular repeat protein